MTHGLAPKALKTFPNERRHYGHSLANSVRLLGWMFLELLINLPSLFRLAIWYRKRQLGKRPVPIVAWVGDNLDEVNGIALNSRKMIREFKQQGYTVYLLGVAFHGKPAKVESEDGLIFMVPGRCSMDQPGYAGSEIALQRLAPLLRLLRRRPVDIIELQTPSMVSFCAWLVAKIVGIKTLSQYRTDIPAYAEMLIKNKLGIFIIKFWVKWFTKIVGPVIVPSEAFRTKLVSMGIKPQGIFKLPRGVDLHRFSPGLRDEKFWTSRGVPPDAFKFLYVGRVSKEKNLDWLTLHFPILLKKQPQAALIVVGDGPYREEMAAKLSPTGRVWFTGVLFGLDLATAFASADGFVFPSTTDTFGNTVIESLASGLPALVSNQGGPCEIVEDGVSGVVFNASWPANLVNKMEWFIERKSSLAEMRRQARNRAKLFTFERAAQKQFHLYETFQRNKKIRSSRAFEN